MPVSNRHIEENLVFLSTSTGFLLCLTIKTRNKYNEVLYAEIPGSFDRQEVSFSKPIPATFYEKTTFTKLHLVMSVSLRKSFLQGVRNIITRLHNKSYPFRKHFACVKIWKVSTPISKPIPGPYLNKMLLFFHKYIVRLFNPLFRPQTK